MNKILLLRIILFIAFSAIFIILLMMFLNNVS